MSMVLEMPMLAPVSRTHELVRVRLQTVYDGLFATLKQQYKIPNEGQVFAFLRKHSQLIPILQEGRAVVSLIFGEETAVKLHIQRDPEVGQECLIAWIQTDLPASDAVDRLLELNDTWLVDRPDIDSELLNFNLGVP